MGDQAKLAKLVNAQVAIMAADAKAAAATGDRIILIAPLDTITVVYGLITCVGAADACGEYLIRLTLERDYPASPPSFVVVTPNGVFKEGTKVCLSIGEYHPSEWLPAMGVFGFAREVYNAFANFTRATSGISIRVSDDVTRRELALQSRAWNEAHHGAVVAALRAAAPPEAIAAIDAAAARRPAADRELEKARTEADAEAAAAKSAQAAKPAEPAQPAEPAVAARTPEVAAPADDYSAFFG